MLANVNTTKRGVSGDDVWQRLRSATRLDGSWGGHEFAVEVAHGRTPNPLDLSTPLWKMLTSYRDSGELRRRRCVLWPGRRVLVQDASSRTAARRGRNSGGEDVVTSRRWAPGRVAAVGGRLGGHFGARSGSSCRRCGLDADHGRRLPARRPDPGTSRHLHGPRHRLVVNSHGNRQLERLQLDRDLRRAHNRRLIGTGSTSTATCTFTISEQRSRVLRQRHVQRRDPGSTTRRRKATTSRPDAGSTSGWTTSDTVQRVPDDRPQQQLRNPHHP